MRATPLHTRSSAGVLGALLSHGWEGVSALETASGVETAAVHLTGVDQGALESLVLVAGRLGLEVITGDDWAVLAGARSRLTAFARPWQLPENLAEAAVQVARALPADLPPRWGIRSHTLSLDQPVIVGILNLTPDSFSDGGELPTVAAAVAHGGRLLADGAAMLDVGGQSTRPGVDAEVSVAEETARVVPVMRALREAFPETPLSVDTVRAEVAQSALDVGADVVNDVSALRLDAGMADVVALNGAGLILMHSRGTVIEMASDRHAHYHDLVGDVVEELRQGLDRASASGILAERIVVDPGFGFAKQVEQNLQLLHALAALRCLGRPILVGPSRKRFLGVVTGHEVGDRDRATAAACALAWTNGARVFRVHAPGAVRDALAIAAAVDPVERGHA